MTSGVARSLSRLRAGLKHRGHDVETLSSLDGWSARIGEFRFSALALRWARVQSLLEGYDLVNLHGPAPFISDTFLMRLALCRDAPPVVYTHHFTVDLEGPGLDRLSQAYHLLTRRLAKASDQIVVTTESYRELMRLPAGTEPRVIPWAFDRTEAHEAEDLELFTGASPLRVLFVGQMRRYKGLPTLVEAVANIEELELTIIGGGRLERQYRALVEDVGASNIVFRGPVNDSELAMSLNRNHVIVLPSVNRCEAFGLVLLEGMASCCVPVASDLPGVRDVAEPTGRVFPPRDVHRLRDVLLELAASPELTSKLQLLSKEYSASFDWNESVDAYEDLFEETIRRKARSAVG